MRHVQRSEILDYMTYEEQRDVIRASAMAAKDLRRVLVGGVLAFLFENHESVRYQVLEMVRSEKLVKEADILHELKTYNELLGQNGALGATLLIGFPDPEERDVKLREWVELPQHLYAKLEDGTKVPATHDGRQVSDGRLSSVQFLRFDTFGQVPVALGSSLPQFEQETELSAAARAALAEDLKDS